MESLYCSEKEKIMRIIKFKKFDIYLSNILGVVLVCLTVYGYFIGSLRTVIMGSMYCPYFFGRNILSLAHIKFEESKYDIIKDEDLESVLDNHLDRCSNITNKTEKELFYWKVFNNLVRILMVALLIYLAIESPGKLVKL